MNWTFWTRKQPTELDDCGTLDSLLSPYADGMASAEESQRVEAHLPGCAACRESLAWMRATRHALASRPVALPPADLRSRIANAIAASSAAPAPVSFATRRAFALRPMLAAAASVAMLGIVSYGLLHHPQPVAVHPAPPPLFASTPPANISAPVVKTVPGPGVKLHLAPHPTAAPKHTRLDPDRVAANTPRQTALEPVAVKTHIQAKHETKMLAEAAPVMAPEKARLVTTRKPAPRKFRPEMLATNKGQAPSAETHRTLAVKPEPKNTDTVVAEAPHTQTPSAPALIEKSPVITSDPAPTVAVASNGEGRFQTAGLIKIPVGAMQKFTHATVGKLDKDAAYASRTIASDGMAYIDGIHSR